MKTAIVIPVLNEERYIKACLDAISRQSVKPDHIFIVDNGCTDATIALCKPYPFVTIINEPTRGICAATKTGLDTAAQYADLLLRCDADSRPHEDWVERAAEAFHGNNVVAVTGPGIFYDASGLRRWLMSVLYMQLYFQSVRLALGQWPLFGSNFAIRTDVWSAISRNTHLDRQDIHDDMDISYHVAPFGHIAYDRSLVMPISARPFASVASLARRFPMAIRSMRLHWPADAPWRVWRRVLRDHA